MGAGCGSFLKYFGFWTDVTVTSHRDNDTYTISATRKYTKITTEFKEKLSQSPSNNDIPLFFIEGHEYPPKAGDFWKWNDPLYVRLPISAHFHNWSKLVATLKLLKEACISGPLKIQPKTVGNFMLSTISTYQRNARSESDFALLANSTIAKEIVETLPKIIDLALKLPNFLSSPVPYLEQNSPQTLYLTRELCSSLLAHCFLCTIPERGGGVQNIRDVNFFRLFGKSKKEGLDSTKIEKIRCLLNYFSQDYDHPPDLHYPHIISFERRCIHTQANWASSSNPLTKVVVDPRGKIEDKKSMLQVDFANKDVGGGVLGDGSVMEEILFCISPEMIISRLFTKTLTDDEVLVMRGTQQFSNYSGYSSSFYFEGGVKEEQRVHLLEVDNLGRMKTEVVALDAINFKRNEVEKQFRRENLDRELHKCFVGFFFSGNDGSLLTPVATGNWGCGAFNGDPEFKFLIQLMAASEAGRLEIWYHTLGDAEQGKSIEKIVEFLKREEVTVGGLYRIVSQFCGEHFHCDSVFDFVIHKLRAEQDCG